MTAFGTVLHIIIHVNAGNHVDHVSSYENFDIVLYVGLHYLQYGIICLCHIIWSEKCQEIVNNIPL